MRERHARVRPALALAVCVAAGMPLGGCVGLPTSAAGNPLYAAMTPMATAVGMGRGLEMGMRLSHTASIERAADITPQEQAHFESLDCPGLRAMAENYTPSGAGVPPANTYAMQAVGARLQLLARLKAAQGC